MEVNFPDDEDQKNDRTIKSIKSRTLAEFNKQEAKGWVIERLNHIELHIVSIISSFFNPKKKREFDKILMNNSIIGFGAKIKVLTNIDGFDPKIIKDLQELSSIRNGFAHVLDFPAIKIIMGREKPRIDDAHDVIEVMTSSGEIKAKEFKVYLAKIHELHSKIQTYLSEFQNKTNATT